MDGSTPAAATPDASPTDPNLNPDGSRRIVIQSGTTNDKELFKTFVPEDYRTKEWVRNIEKADNPRLELFKQIEEKDKLLGQKIQLVVPTADAPADKWKEFHRATGVPETADEYKYEGLKPEGENKDFIEMINKSRSEEYIKRVAKRAHEIGVRPDQFAKLGAIQDEVYIEIHKANLAENARLATEKNTDLVKRSTEIFGTRRDQVAANAEKLLATMPANIKPFLDSLSTEGKIALAATLDDVYTRYVKEDSPVRTAGASVQADTFDTLRAQRKALMDSPAGSQMNHANYKETQGKIKAINNRMRELLK